VKIDQLPREAALQLIGRLKQGRNVIFGTSFFSVGREKWISGAEQVLSDIETTGDSVVRFIRGDYGVGKTNFAARLFEKALHRGWAGAYIELSDSVMLHEFHQVFAQVCEKLYLPEQIDYSNGISIGPSGVIGALESFYKKLRVAVGLGPGADLSASARTDILSRVNSVLQHSRIYGDFATAVRIFFEGRLDGNRDACLLAQRWFRADPDARVLGVLRPVTKVNGKEHLRALSALLHTIGYRGTLVIIDELERIMEEPKNRRRKSYTILRELIDNVDGENGMKSSCLYAAAPPGQFESTLGFIEVDALASRIQAPILVKGLTDYTAAIIDLDTAPLSTEQQLQLARKIRALHGRARDWDGRQTLSDKELSELITEINSKRGASRLRVREICIELVAALEGAHINA
jgi:hypothetical protein